MPLLHVLIHVYTIAYSFCCQSQIDNTDNFMNYTTGDTDYVRGPLITFLTDTFTKLYDILRILYFVKYGRL